MDEEKKEMNVSKYVVPVVVVAVFALLLFGAGYAYFAANVNIDNNVTIEEIDKFLSLPYIKVDRSILEKYDFYHTYDLFKKKAMEVK